MRPCCFPTPLKPGDSLCAIAPSGALREQTAFHQGLEIWQARGYQVDVLPGYDDRWGYLAGTDKARCQQLATALANPDYRAVLCVRGGWGGARLLETWQATWGDLIMAEPKWLVGFSDITSLLWALSLQGISGVHGPLLTTIAQEPGWSLLHLFDLVEGRALEPLQGKGWGGGIASGLLLPANLTVATHLLNTAYQPDLQGIILALEDVGEAPYRLDRMLTQWRMTGALRQVAGIALGRFSLCDAPSHIPSFTVEEVLRDRLGDLGIPIVADLPFGHEGTNIALPVGVPVTLDGDRGALYFAEAE
ncbi:LD-carboxypeptidase [Alkalinema sp. FACHB-956]|uniref:S66 peptidase family protein n=1 Tax=Alkalinema sp. FACHB-956 TaxID=2692768 RepID=UPI00168333BA|nr:LD-carboxypeptidase [Alkalinema sp. FACHB-956]MBD2328454.1 LD-carboxypeptidase [Alkalinema sp. FACHB-956]